MFKSLLVIWGIPELRNKILFTISIMFVFRIGSHITVPGINFSVLESYLNSNSASSQGLTDYIDLFAGGAFKRLSLFALGIMPYISASIIIQLLMIIVPSLQKLQKEGEYGRKKINYYTRYGTVLLCTAQAYGITVYIQSLHEEILGRNANSVLIDNGGTISFILMTILVITTGTVILMWFGELITERGIGNGISLIIFAGIISGAPSAVNQFIVDIQKDQVEVILALVLICLFIVMIAFSIVLTEGVRKISIQYGKRIVGRKMVQGSNQSLPIKLNSANVMPIIFASSLMLFPSQIASYMQGDYKDFASVIVSYLSPGSLVYLIVYSLLIIFFAYFYTSIQYNPVDIAEALKKNSGYIPGVRPGVQTSEFIGKVLNRITLSGALFLTFIAIVPDIIINIWNLQKFRSLAYLFGGTSLLIIVGVCLDTLKQIESQLVMRNYDGFMFNNKKIPLRRPTLSK